MRKLAAPLLAALLAAALVAGCSSGGSPSSSSEASTTTSAAPPGTQPPGSGAVHEACGLVEEAVTLLFSGGVSALAPEAGGLQERLEALRADLPAELRDDVEVVMAEGREYLDLLAGLATGDPAHLLDPQVQQQMADAAERLDRGPASQAIDDIQAWAGQNCAGLGG